MIALSDARTVPPSPAPRTSISVTTSMGCLVEDEGDKTALVLEPARYFSTRARTRDSNSPGSITRSIRCKRSHSKLGSVFGKTKSVRTFPGGPGTSRYWSPRGCALEIPARARADRTRGYLPQTDLRSQEPEGVTQNRLSCALAATSAPGHRGRSERKLRYNRRS